MSPSSAAARGRGKKTASPSKRTPRRRKGTGRSEPAPKSRIRRTVGWLVKLSLGVVLLGAVTAVGAYGYFSQDLPTVDQLLSYDPPQTNRVVDRHGKTIGEFFQERRTVVPIEEVPREFILSVLAAEDADFYAHEGLDYPGLVRAVFRAIVSQRRPRGTSTITQQVVKLLLLSPRRTLSTKIRELILARRLEQSLSKDEILELYINHINFGHGHYGIEEAAQFYFDKPARDLSLNEASHLAGVPQSPTRLSPRAHPEAARKRQLFVLSQLEEKRASRWPDLNLEALEEAKAGPPALAAAPDVSNLDPALTTASKHELRELVPLADLDRGGYTVTLTIDIDLQRKVRNALREGLRAIDARHAYRGPLRARRRGGDQTIDRLRPGRTYLARVTGYGDDDTLLLRVGGHDGMAEIPPRYNPDSLAVEDFAAIGAKVRVSLARQATEQDELNEFRLDIGPQGAVVVLDVRSREILALVGGYENQPGFNRATQARRQPGSTFKPFVYALALRERLYNPASIVLDAPQVYGDYRPSDFASRSYRGPISLRESLAVSANPVAKQLIDRVGPKNVVQFAQSLGISSPLEANVPLALGASEVTLLELTNAYAVFPAGGRAEPTRLLRRIEGPGGQRTAVPRPGEVRDVLKPPEAFLVTSLLQSVITSGTGRRARPLGRPAAGKTGTSNDARDAWFVGYTPDIVCGVWVGFDDRRGLGRNESGSRAALPIWLRVMKAATRGTPATEFPEPSGIVHADIDPNNGLLAYEGMENAADEVFLLGTEPTETTTPPDAVDPNTFLMDQIGSLDAVEP